MNDAELIIEVRNEAHVPFNKMSERAQQVLCSEWKQVEWYSRDFGRWMPNPICPRQWNEEAYRLPPELFPPKLPKDMAAEIHDAMRWRVYATSPQTAMALGSKLDPNSQQDWVAECNRLVDDIILKQGHR